MAREMKDSGAPWIGEIPAAWNVVRLGTQYTERKTKVSDKEYSPLSVTMKGIVPQLATAAKTDAHDDRKLVCKGDFVINSRSDRRGSCGISPYDGSVSLINTILCPRDEMNPQYYDWLFHSTMFSDEFYKWGHGIVDDLWTTNWQDMKRIFIPEPPLEEQEKIASFLARTCAEIDAVIGTTQTTVEEYKKLKQAIITQAVTKGIRRDMPMRDSGIKWIGTIPEHWKLEKLRNHTSMLTPMRDRPENLDGEIPWIRIEDYDGKYILASKDRLGVSEETVKAMNLKIYPVGTVLCTSSCDLGKCAIVSRELVSNQRFIGIIPNEDTFPDFLYYLMVSNAERLNFLSTGTIQANLSRKEFEQLYMQFPPYSEQVQIAHYLDNQCEVIDSLLLKKQDLILGLEEYKKSLIYEYVTGKREVNRNVH